MLQSLHQFYEGLFSKKVSNSNAHYLKDVSLPKLTKEQSKQCKGEITENKIRNTLGTSFVTKHPERMVLPVSFT